MKIGIIYMAAGNSRRFGTNKLLYPLNGKELFRHCLERIRTVCAEFPEMELFVVSQYREILEYISEEETLHPVYSPDSSKGISYTIRAGLDGVRRRMPDCGGVVFFTADQPFLKKETIRRFLLEVSAEHPEFASIRFEGQPGSPTYFSKEHFSELLRLEGDAGGRKVMKRYLDQIRYVEAAERMELYDVDKMSEMLAISHTAD